VSPGGTDITERRWSSRKFLLLVSLSFSETASAGGRKSTVLKEPAQTADASGGSPPTPDKKGDQAAPGTLVARVTRRCCFTEGSIFFIVVRDRGGQAIFERAEYPRSGKRLVVRHALAPGSYEVSTFERPCDGTCPRGAADSLGFLDPATSRCRWSVHVESGAEYILRVFTGPQIDGCAAD
jgi:hypothetical protein